MHRMTLLQEMRRLVEVEPLEEQVEQAEGEAEQGWLLLQEQLHCRAAER